MLSQAVRKSIPIHIRQRLRLAVAYFYTKHVAAPRLRKIRRGIRESCWCGGDLSPFPWHRSYGVCQACGTYANRHGPHAEELDRLYSFDLYWHIKQRADGLPTIEKRPAHDKADGRVNYWLKLIEKYAPPTGQVIEIGCAHGALLKELKERGYDCIGVEIDEKVAAWTRKTMNVDVCAGFFPRVELPRCDLFLAFDVLEHSPDPEAFMRAAARLLKPGGVAIIQTAVDRYEYLPPFGSRFKDAFDDLEHLFIFTDRAILELARRVQLKVITLEESIWLMGEICILQGQ